MELNQVARRVVGQHWRLIVLVVVAGVGAALLISGGSPGYTATTRLVLDTPDPTTRTESEAIADTGKALATSPTLVRAAFEKAGVEDRNAAHVAANDVSVAPLGTSGILKLEVTDRDRYVAAHVANALALQVIRTRLSISNGQLDQIVNDLDSRIGALDRKIAALDAKIDALTVQGVTSGSERDAAAQTRDLLAQQRSALDSERANVFGDAAQRPQPRIVSAATPPANAASSRLLEAGVLGAILGLILGTGIAALIETFQPTVVGGGALAQATGAPFLGAVSTKDGTDDVGAALVANRLRLAARPTNDVGLVAAQADVNIVQVADRLARFASRSQGDSPVRIRPLSLGDASEDDVPKSIAVVTPPAIKEEQLARLDDLVRLLSLPIVGVIISSPPRDHGLAGRMRRTAKQRSWKVAPPGKRASASRSRPRVDRAGRYSESS
jgi:uncharacterized protein involved in exopolysaccharide biosynthesis